SPSLLGDPHDTLTLSTLSFHYARHHPDLHSFPTRRSSDLRRGLSAGRVQSVAVRLIFEREKEIEAFKPEEYWSIEARLEGDGPPPFLARLFKIRGERLDNKQLRVGNGDEAKQLVDGLAGATWKVTGVETKERRRFP